MISSKGRKILKCIGITFLSILGLFVLLLILLNLAIRPQNVQNLVEIYSKEYINAEVKTDTIEISFLRNFPYASLSIKDCRIRSLAFESLDSTRRTLVPVKADSLARVERLNISVSLLDLLNSKLVVKGIELESANIYAYASQFGINNWDIVKMDADTTASDSMSFEININKVSIKDGAQISLCSVTDSVNIDFSLRELLLKGRISSNVDDNYITNARLSRLVLSSGHFNKVVIDSTLDNFVKLSVDSLDISKTQNSNKALVDVRMRTDLKLHGITMANDIPFEMKGGIEFNDLDKGKLGIDLEDFTVNAATLPLTMDGSLILSRDGITIPNLKGNIDNYNIKNILAYIPEQFLIPGSIETDAAITLNANIRGRYLFTKNEYPTVDFSLAIPSNTLSFKGTNADHSLKNIEVAVKFHFDQNGTKNNVLDISRLSMEGRGISLDVKGKIAEYTDDPLFDLMVKSNLNLDTLSAIIPMSVKMIARGAVKGDVSLKGKMSSLNLFSLSNNDINADIYSDSLRLKMEDYGIDFNFGKTSLHSGFLENSTDTLLTNKSRIFNVSLNLDTLYLNYKDSMLLSGSKISLSANQEPHKIEKTKPSSGAKRRRSIVPRDLKIDGQFTMGGLSFVDFDSTKIRLRGANSAFSIVPWTDGKTPVLAINAGFRGIGVVQDGLRFFAANSNFALKTVAHSPNSRISDTISNQTLHRQKVVSDSTENHTFNSKRFARAVLKYWDIQGVIKSEHGRIITSSFPIRTRFTNFNLTMTNDGMNFQNTKFDIGSSSVTLTGKLQGFANAVTEHQKLTFNGSILADSLDIDQMMQALTNSRDVSLNDNRSDEAIETAMEKAAETDTMAIIAPTIPGFIEADLNLNLKNVIFCKKVLKSIQGNLIAQNSIFQLNQFNVVTEFGDIDIDAFYSAKKLDDISLGFDMKMKQFEVSDLIGFIPNVDSLLPMLRSFSGKITCTLSAMSKMDSLFNIKMETINGVGSFEGENVVLMDGEAFSEIAKKLKFKNKAKNYIDKISVQFVAADNVIEIFPFVLQMDRYKAAVSGTQNMDMSFNYHISVLKSPIPFRIGLNIFGTIDKMKFRIGKCLYKNENVPIYTKEIESARVNLGDQIKGVLFNGVEKAISDASAADLAKTAETEQNKINDMEELSQKELQQLEATKVDKSAE